MRQPSFASGCLVPDTVPSCRRSGRKTPAIFRRLRSEWEHTNRGQRRSEAADEDPRGAQWLVLCLTCRCGADPRGRRFGRHRLAGMTEAHDIMKLPLADAEEGGSITYCVASEALGTQPRFAERDTQRRVVGTQSGPLGGRCVFNFKQKSSDAVGPRAPGPRPKARAARASRADGPGGSSAEYRQHRGSDLDSCVP